MNSTLLNFTRFKSNPAAGQTRQAAGLLKTKKNVMKLKIKFGEETHFNEPIRRTIHTRMPLWPGTRLSLRALAMTERTSPIKHLID
jgi:hypothetical protein